MDYLQYVGTPHNITMTSTPPDVLNLVINGLPSIQELKHYQHQLDRLSFKPCYKWITFNTLSLKRLQILKNTF